jgi:ribose 5-phosphate isomerase B
MTIAIGADHAGFLYKSTINKMLQKSGHSILDFGADSESSVDYPDHAHPLADAVAHGKADFGILICGSGNGVCMAANKHKGVRAALCWNKATTSLARQHNNANVICLPARFISMRMAAGLVKIFLSTDFEGGRHQLRVNKI